VDRILVVEDHEPEMRLMVWYLTDDGSDVKVSSTVGGVIADIETFRPDTVVFNSRALGDAKDACIALIRALARDIRIIDVSAPAAGRRFVDVTHHENDPRSGDAGADRDFTAEGLIHLIHRRRAAS
jgi:hypothetical protein